MTMKRDLKHYFTLTVCCNNRTFCVEHDNFTETRMKCENRITFCPRHANFIQITTNETQRTATQNYAAMDRFKFVTRLIPFRPNLKVIQVCLSLCQLHPAGFSLDFILWPPNNKLLVHVGKSESPHQMSSLTTSLQNRKLATKAIHKYIRSKLTSFCRNTFRLWG